MGDPGVSCKIGYNPSSRISGTNSYMAPEQLEFAPYAQSVDIWGLAVTVYFLLTYDSCLGSCIFLIDCWMCLGHTNRLEQLQMVWKVLLKCEKSLYKIQI